MDQRMADTKVPQADIDTTSFDKTLASAHSTMMFSEVISLALDSFCASKTRFMLTMLGMIIGSASIILVVTVGMTGKLRQSSGACPPAGVADEATG